MLKDTTLEVLKRQREEKFEFKGIDKKEIAIELLNNIGDPDGEIRDRLIYPSLAHLLHDKHFNEEELEGFLEMLFDDEHLFYDIEENAHNSVLTRSFSSLQIVILLFVHKRDNIINEELIKDYLNKYLDYFNQESHYEGYNDTVGWLHSIAHAADVFDQFLTIEHFHEDELKKIFEAVLVKMKQRHYYFSHDEDERMVVGLTKAIQRDILNEEYLLDWIDRFSIYDKNSNYPEMYYITKNVRNVLRALYFALLKEEKYQNIIHKLVEVLEKNVTLR